jgi:hypothetical protein
MSNITCFNVPVRGIGVGNTHPNPEQKQHIAHCKNCSGIIDEIKERIKGVQEKGARTPKVRNGIPSHQS